MENRDTTSREKPHCAKLGFPFGDANLNLSPLIRSRGDRTIRRKLNGGRLNRPALPGRVKVFSENCMTSVDFGLDLFSKTCLMSMYVSVPLDLVVDFNSRQTNIYTYILYKEDAIKKWVSLISLIYRFALLCMFKPENGRRKSPDKPGRCASSERQKLKGTGFKFKL